MILNNPHEESNALSCENTPHPCENNNCTPSQWIDMLLNNTEEDSILYYQQELLYSIGLEDDISGSITLLNSLTDSLEYLELLIGIHVNLGDYESASSLLENHPQETERDNDYYDFYTSIFNRYFNELPEDSISSEDLTLYADIISRKNDISDLVMAFLNFQFDSTFVIIPEQWEEESFRPVLNPKTNQNTRKHNQKSEIETRIYPNPSNNELTIYFDSKEYDLLDVQIVSLLGSVVFEKVKLKKQEAIKIDISHITPGVYNLKYNYQGSCIENKKIVIIH